MAYEMRISDWSSDGCSSDLPQNLPPRGSKNGTPEIIQTPLASPLPGRRRRPSRNGARRANAVATFMSTPSIASGSERETVRPMTDRKSVGPGKSVYIRVYPGGRQNIKKNKPNKYNIT